MSFRLLLCAILSLGVGGPSSVEAASGSSTGRCGLIFVNRFKPEEGKLATFSVSPTGEDLTRLTPWKKSSVTIAVSPDARYMIGSRYQPATDTFRLIKASTRGGPWQRLTPDDDASYGGPDISPDGQFIAFNRSEGVNDSNLYVMDIGTKEMSLVAEGAQFGSWAGSSHRLLYSMVTGELLDRNLDLFTANRDGGDVVQLTSTTDADEITGGTFSPEGTEILFERYPQGQMNENDGPYADVWVMDSDGTDQRQLTERQDDLNGVEDPSWSPDGARISYDFVNDGFSGAVIALRNGGGAGFITEKGDGFSGDALFSPNGQKVVVDVQQNSEGDILMARADGSNERWFMRSSRFDDSLIAWPSC